MFPARWGDDVAAAYIDVTDETFADAIERPQTPAIVDFWAEWCPPCHAIAPAFEELAAQYAGKVTFAKLNTDDSPETPGRHGVMGMPTLILFEGGREVGRIVGAMKRDELKRRIASVFGEPA